MSTQYESLVRQSGALNYWPLGRYLGTDVIGGSHFTALPPNRQRQDFGDFTRMVGGGGAVAFSRATTTAVTNNFTMEIWVRAISPDQNWSIGNNNGGSDGYTFGTRFANGQMWAIAQGVALLETTVRSMPLGQWQHVAFIRDASVWQYWLNGVRFDTGANNNNPAAPTGDISIGTGAATDAMRYAIYTRVLSYAEIQQHMEVGYRSLGPQFAALEVVSADVRPSFLTVGATGYEPDEVVAPNVVEPPFATIDFDPFTPSVPAIITPPFGNIGFYVGPIQPGSEDSNPPISVEPVFLAEGGLPPFVPPSLPPTIPGGSPVGPGVPLPPLSSGGMAGIRFYQGPPWRWVVTDLETNTITFLDRLALDVTVTYGLNKGATAKVSVPSANPEINILHTDGEPFVSEGNRLLYGFRREGGMEEGHPELWRVRFAGKILQVEDNGELENARTIITAFDPWHLLYQRPMINEDNEFPDFATFFSFDDTQVGNIALIFLRNTIINNGSGLNDHGDLGIDTGDGPFPGAEPGNLPGTQWWDGEYENTTQYDTKCEQGMMVGEVWDQQLATGAVDIIMTPIYDPVNRPGYMVDLSIFEQAGEIRPDAVFAWDKPSRNLRGIDALKDGTNRANTIRYYYGQGGPPTGGGIPLSYGPSITKYGETWAQTFYAMRIDEIVNAVATLQLDLMQDGVKTVQMSPSPERMPFLFTEFWLGDRVPVFASNNLRQEIIGYQRIYGCVLSIDENSYEQVPQLLVSPSDV